MKKVRRPQGRETRWREADRSPAGGAWFIAGINGVTECLSSPAVSVKSIWVDRRLPVTLDREIRLSKISVQSSEGGETPHGHLVQGVAALVMPPSQPDLDDLLAAAEKRGETPLLVALDQVEDPMNLGQILRTCEGAGVTAVLLPKHRSAHMTQTVAQVSQGAFAWVPVCEVGNLRNTLDRLKQAGFVGYWLPGWARSRPLV